MHKELPGSRIRSLALCCLLNHLSLIAGRLPRPSRNRSFRLARAVVFDVTLCWLHLLSELHVNIAVRFEKPD